MTSAEDTGGRPSFADDLRRGRDEARAVGGSIGGIANDLKDLAAAESSLARAEMQDSISALMRAAVFGAFAALLATVGVVFLFRTVMGALYEAGLAEWAAAVVTALIALALAAVMGFFARRQAADITLVPKRTMESVKEDIAWVREQTKRSSA